MKKFKKYLYIPCIIWVICLYLFFLPAINIDSLGFWHFVIYAVLPFILINIDYSLNIKEFFTSKKNKTFGVLAILFLIFIFLADIIGTPLLGGLNSYRNRISISEASDFSSLDEFDKSQVQIVDKNVSVSLADRVFGEMGAEIVSQYEISNNYASVVVDNTMYRLTPIEYSGFIKWLSTKNTGTPGFISVNVTTGEAQFHELEQGLKYTNNAKFFHNLYVHLRLNHPTCIFGNTKFEVDDNFKPYWVSQVMSYAFIGKAEDVKGVVITDPVSGDSKYYDTEDVPSWVDNVYDAPLVCEQYDSYGRYINGLVNLSQKGITATTDDYAYLQKDGHLWMYTGITSIGNDESNVGFIYVDLQDKEVIYVVSAGAEEYSARASAEGALQEKGYTSVFPTMVSINDEPVYFMGLKDNAGLIKAYAFVSYKNYQKVGVGSTVEEAYKNYTGKNSLASGQTNSIEIIVNDIQTAVINGYSMYYIETSNGDYYHCSIEISNKLPFIKVGDNLKVEILDNEIINID